MVVADDHRMMGQMLVKTLSEVGGVEVLAQVCCGKEALEVCRTLQPDVLIIDLDLPDLSGVEVARLLTESDDKVSVLVLSGIEDETALFESIAAGVRGYLPKDASLEELVNALHTVSSGQAFLHPRCTLSVLKEFQRCRQALTGPRASQLKVVENLSPREKEVLHLLGEGLSNKEIGERLIISEKTAKTHVANILRRLGVKDRVAAAILAVKAGY